MPLRRTSLLADHYYHVYNRGVAGNVIFLKPDNYVFFLHGMRRFFASESLAVIAYCLMPSHFHLLVHLKTDTFSTIMQRLSMSYVNALNSRLCRSGPLFQGRFQARLVEEDTYLLYLSRYIHLNPVVARLVTKPERWLYSSYRDYVGLRSGTLPHPEIVLDQLIPVSQPPSARYAAYRRFVEDPGIDGSLIARLVFEE